MPGLSKHAQHDLEVDFVDTYSMYDTLEALADIAFEKASHVRENWQDSALAKSWERVGNAIRKAADKAWEHGGI